MRPLLIFYILVLYVLLQFCWWAYLLIELNQEVYNYRLTVVELLHETPEKQKAELAVFKKNLHKRWMMVAGEGAVFLTLLIIGINQTRKAFKKEVILSKQQKNFLLSITHEFKSPLAAIKLSLQTLKKHELEKEKHDLLLERSLSETNRFQNLIENALTAAQYDNRTYQLNKEEFNLSELIREIILGRVTDFNLNHEITYQIADDVYMMGDSLAIHALVLNLLENAEKYSAENSRTHVELSERDKYIVIRISDNGIGIPNFEREKIFEKFYRVGNEDTRKTKGTGLGLFIVKNVVMLHNGKIFIKDNQPQGTTFEIIFKK